MQAYQSIGSSSWKQQNNQELEITITDVNSKILNLEAILKKLRNKNEELFNDIVQSVSEKDAVRSVILANELKRRRVFETKIEFALKMLYRIKIKMIHGTQSNPQQFKVSILVFLVYFNIPRTNSILKIFHCDNSKKYQS